MNKSEKAALAALVTDVLAYYRQDVSEFTLTVWTAACEQFSIEQVRKALTAHATDAERGQFAPKVADLVRILQGTHTDRAQLAWGKAFEAMGTVGAYTDVVFDDPAIHACIEDLGGWPKVCRADMKEIGHLQHRFCTSHKAYTGRGEFAYPRRLMGDRSPDHEYEKYGRPLPRPALVGDPEVCRQVWKGGSVAGKTAISHQDIGLLAIESIRPRLPS